MADSVSNNATLQGAGLHRAIQFHKECDGTVKPVMPPLPPDVEPVEAKPAATGFMDRARSWFGLGGLTH